MLDDELHANDRTRIRERVNDVRKLRKKQLTHPPSAFSHRCGNRDHAHMHGTEKKIQDSPQ